jgi:hypothetical protein
LTAAIPLLAINTLVITVCPPCRATKSFTGPGAALSTELPPTINMISEKVSPEKNQGSGNAYPENEELALVLERTPFFFSLLERYADSRIKIGSDLYRWWW